MTVRHSMTREEVMGRVRVDPDSGCWHWLGSMAKSRKSTYPVLGSTSARKMAFEAFVGSFPDGSDLAMLGMSCSCLDCINPDHLDAGAGNALFRAGADAKKAATHCKHGHEYAAVGTYVNKAGGKVCRACVSERGKRNYLRRKNAT